MSKDKKTVGFWITEKEYAELAIRALKFHMSVEDFVAYVVKESFKEDYE